MNIVIIEDEAPAARKLAKLIAAEEPVANVVAILESVRESILWLENNPLPDIIFSDIQLSDDLSFEIFRHINTPVPIIFTTAYDEYAIEAFRHHSIDYLLKPIKPDDLARAIAKFRLMSSKTQAQAPDFAQIIKELTQKLYRQRFVVQSGSAFVPVMAHEVAYFYSEDSTTFIRTRDDKRHIVADTLDKLETELDPRHFFRANRQYLINIESVVRFETFFNQKLIVKLAPPSTENVVVSKLKATEFKNWMNE